MKLKLLTTISLGILFASHLSAQSKNGKIITGAVEGSVTASKSGSESSRSVNVKDAIDINETVTVGENSSSVLIFSNGATLTLEENTVIRVEKFIQDQFTTPFALAVENEEPTTSVTKLHLEKGQFVCTARKLNIDNGSSFEIHTPAGSASIRGTTFTGVVSGNTFTLSCTEGKVVFTDSNGTVTEVPAGSKLVVTFSETGAILTSNVEEMTDTEIAAVEQAVADDVQSVEQVTFSPTLDALLDPINVTSQGISNTQPPGASLGTITDGDP